MVLLARSPPQMRLGSHFFFNARSSSYLFCELHHTLLLQSFSAGISQSNFLLLTIEEL